MKALLSFILISVSQPIYSHQISPMMSMSLQKCSKQIRQQQQKTKRYPYEIPVYHT